jgi:hypothetical protein
MHRQQAMPAALTHTPRTPPHACNSCPLTSTARAHAHTRTRTHSAPPAPRIRSHHTSAAPATRPTGPRDASLSGGTRPARAQRPSPGARARAWHRLPPADRHPAPGGGGGGGGGTATHRRPLRSRAGRRKGWPLGTLCCPVGSSHAPGAALTATKSPPGPLLRHKACTARNRRRRGASTHKMWSSSSSLSYTGRVESRPAALAPHGARSPP